MVKFICIQDVPAFVGLDMKEYGPWARDKIIEADLPERTLQILIDRKLITIVDITLEKRLKILFCLDKKAKHLFEGRYWYAGEFTDSEGATKALIVKLLNFNLSKEEIYKVLDMSELNWRASGDLYKNSLYDEGDERHKNQGEVEKNAWLDFIPERIFVYPAPAGLDSKSYVEIVGEGVLANLEEEDLLNSNKFRQLYFIQKGIMLPPIANDAWSEILTVWRNTCGLVLKEREEAISEEQEAVDEIIDYINSCKVVAKKEDSLRYGFCWHENKNLYVPSDQIAKIAKEHKVSLRKLSHFLKNYTKKGTETIRIGTSVRRFWMFNPEKFSVDLSSVVDLSPEKAVEEDKKDAQ